MIVAIPKGIFSRDFLLLQEDRLLDELDVSSWHERAEFEIAGMRFRLQREGMLSGAFLLVAEGRVLAQATKPSAFYSHFELQIGGQSYTLRKLSIWSRRFGLFLGEEEVGSIRPAGHLTRRALIDLPPDWHPAIQIFVF